MSMPTSVRTEWVAWPTAKAGFEDPPPQGHMMQVCQFCPDGDKKGVKGLPKVVPAPVGRGFPSTARVACLLDVG